MTPAPSLTPLVLRCARPKIGDRYSTRLKQAYGLEMQEAQKAEEEYRRHQQIQDRLYKQDEELRMKEQEEDERRLERAVWAGRVGVSFFLFYDIFKMFLYSYGPALTA